MEKEIEMTSPVSELVTPAIQGVPIDLEAETLLREMLGSLETLSREQQEILGGEIVTALLRYKVKDLTVHTSKPSSFKFWSFLGAGVVSIGAGTLTLGLGDKPGTMRTVVGSLGIGIGTVSLAGAVMTFPTQRETVSYGLVYKTTPEAGSVTQQVIIILPLGLSDVEFVRSSVQQLARQIKKQDPNPAKQSFDAEQKEDTIGSADPGTGGSLEQDSLSSDDESASSSSSSPGQFDLEPEASGSFGGQEASEQPAAPSADSKAAPAAKPPAARTDVDIKYGSVIKAPEPPRGVSEHGSLF